MTAATRSSTDVIPRIKDPAYDAGNNPRRKASRPQERAQRSLKFQICTSSPRAKNILIIRTWTMTSAARSHTSSCTRRELSLFLYVTSEEIRCVAHSGGHQESGFHVRSGPDGIAMFFLKLRSTFFFDTEDGSQDHVQSFHACRSQAAQQSGQFQGNQRCDQDGHEEASSACM